MSLFKHHDRAVYMDLSSELREPLDWKAGTLRTLEYHLHVAAFAFEPLNGFLAIGTSSGAIHIFGGPSVETTLNPPEPLRVKFLQFAISVFKLISIDEQDRLHVWDLGTGQPKLQQISAFSHPINSLTLSPSHTHAFVALNSGEIKTYDLICLRKSPYVIPNMWTLYEKKMEASGMANPSPPESRIPMDVTVHPRDLNLVFVAYGGGIVLSDLSQRNTLRVYEYMLPAGAPGGAGYESSDLLTHRQPSVTSLAIHPAGHFFAVGYADGSIAFWAVEDEDQPLLVRTIDKIDVNIVDGDELEKHFPQDQTEKKTVLDREPIFKLAWSGFPNSTDPRGGETALTILGGQISGEAPGLTVHWLPPFNPSEPPAATGNQVGLHPQMRKAMRTSVLPLKTYFYSSPGVIQDFLLTPRDSPRFAGAFDPVSILLLSEYQEGTRSVQAFEFPPPAFSASVASTSEDPPSASDGNTEDCLTEDLASALQSMKSDVEPQRIELPSTLWNGPNGIIYGQLLKLEREPYQILVNQQEGPHQSFPLKGGVAWTDESMNTEAKLAKYQPHRVLVTHHRDLSIHFQDISAQILIRSNASPIQFDFPRHLFSLTIDVASTLADASIATRTSHRFFDEARIKCISIASDSLECCVAFETGELLIYRLTSGHPKGDVPYREAEDQELIILEHILGTSNDRFYPYFMLAAGRGPIVAFELSDIGFLAVSYADGSLFVVDMRVPKVMMRPDEDKKTKNRQSAGLLLKHSAIEVVKTLVWTIRRLETDPHPHVRLIAVSESGASRIFTISRGSGSSSPWAVGRDVIEAEGIAHPVSRGSFVIDSKTGAQCAADRSSFAASLQAPPTPATETHCLWVTCGVKGVKCVVDFTGERVGKADWNSKHGAVQSVNVVERNGCVALVAFTDKHEAVVYSLPNLEFLYSLQLPSVSDEALSVDETGDYVEWIRHSQSGLVQQAGLNTLFNIRRAYALPDVDLSNSQRSVPSQPQPVSVGPTSLISSWFRYGQSMTGDQLDELLAGPDRPIPEEPQKPTQSWRALDATGTPATILRTAQETQSNLYNRLAAAVSERGQKLGDLEESFNSLEQGSRNMVTEAKKLAAQQTTKRWFNFS